jgi:hypothetical protein
MRLLLSKVENIMFDCHAVAEIILILIMRAVSDNRHIPFSFYLFLVCIDYIK